MNTPPMHSYLPELHDVHPGSVAALAELLSALPPPARDVAALLVVPNWRGGDRIDRAPSFADRVRTWSGDVVLHGFAHAGAPSWWNWFWHGTSNDAEFARLDRDSASRLISEGADLLEAVTGVRPRWFCAPRWLQSAGTTAALRGCGLSGWMLRDQLQTADGTSWALPAVWFDNGVRLWTRRGAAVVRRRRLHRLLQSGHPFRLALHPRDVEMPETWRGIQDLVATLEARGWAPASLAQTIAEGTRGDGEGHGSRR